MNIIQIEIIGKYINTITMEKAICNFDEKVDIFRFKLKRYYGDIDFFEDAWEFFFAYKDTLEDTKEIIFTPVKEDDIVYLDWTPEFPNTYVDETIDFQIRAKKNTDDGLVKWNTNMARVYLGSVLVEKALTKTLAEQYLDRFLQLYEEGKTEAVRSAVLEIFNEKGIKDVTGILLGNGTDPITGLTGDNGQILGIENGVYKFIDNHASGLSLVISCSNGATTVAGDTVLTVKLFDCGEDITSSALDSEFTWKRIESDWSREGTHGKSITISTTDLVTYSANFMCYYSSGDSGTANGVTISNTEAYNSISVFIESSNGGVFLTNQVDTTLSAKVYRAGNDITSSLTDSKFTWKRTSEDPLDDIRWNALPKAIGHKSVDITNEDMNGRSVFDCTVLI